MVTPTSAIARQWQLNAPIIALRANMQGSWVAATLGDGSIAMLRADDEKQEPQRIALHDGISLSLCADADGAGFLSGGDDGKLLVIEPDAKAATPLADHKNKWLDHVAADAGSGKRAYSVGKQVYLLDAEGQPQGVPFTHPSSVGGLAFSPKGKRIAVSHYNGVSLWWTNAKDEQQPSKLNWKGSHLDIVWSPDGKILLTSLQEAALHGWRLSDQNEMRMLGYANKIKSVSWSAKAKYLCTSGAGLPICWPFFGGGPWGKPPLAVGDERAVMVTQVAAHPRDEMLAAGYADGMITLAPLDGRIAAGQGNIMIHPPVSEAGATVTGLVWNADGTCLFATLESGYVMLFTVESVANAVASDRR
jgi:WD40 repeat protein